MSAAGALLGLTLAAGLLTLLGGLAAVRRPSLLVRVAPYAPVTAATRSLVHRAPTSLDLVGLFLRPRGRSALEARVVRAGLGSTMRYRIDQLVWGGLGVVGGGGLGLIAINRGSEPVALLVLAGIGAALGLLLCDRRLTGLVRRRSVRLARQLPDIAELLAFAVAAGESPVAALDRVSGMVAGDLADEIAFAVRDVRSGATLEQALRSLDTRIGSPDVERFVDALLVAIERGTPMVEVLRAQAADARASSRRGLMESAGRRDVLMLVPVVFLVLPSVVLIAVYPGFQSLQILVP